MDFAKLWRRLSALGSFMPCCDGNREDRSQSPASAPRARHKFCLDSPVSSTDGRTLLTLITPPVWCPPGYLIGWESLTSQDSVTLPLESASSFGFSPDWRPPSKRS